MNRDDLIDFVYDEAAMLDDMRWEDWKQLFTEDGRYWMPLEWQQEDPIMQPSLMYEDLLLLTVRIERLTGERTFSQKPKSRCHHVLSRPFVDVMDHDNGLFVTHTPFHYVETRLDDQFLLAANARHELVLEDGKLKIRLKRVDLLNCDAAFGNIQLFL